MTERSAGWRSQGSRLRARGWASAPEITQPASMWMRPPADGLAEVASGPPWTGVQWSLLYVGLLGYIGTIITYTFPIGDVAMAVALLGVLMEREPIRIPPFLVVFGLFTVWCALGYPSSEHSSHVLDRLDLLWRVWLIALVVVNALRTRQRLRFYLFFFLGAYALFPIRGTIFNYVGGYRQFGRAIWNYAFANPNDLAAITLLVLSMCIALYVRESKGWPRLAAISGLVLLPLAILLTQSRGAFLAIAVFALLVLVRQRRRGRAIVIVAAIAAVGVLAAPSTLWDRISGLGNITSVETIAAADAEGSAGQRFEIWRVATAIIGDHPVTGVGAGAYEPAHGQYAMSPEFDPVARGQRDTHSTYLNVLAETGVVGFALFMAMIATVIVHAERTRKMLLGTAYGTAQQILFLEIGLLGYLVAGIFGSFAHVAFLYLHLALLWSASQIARDAAKQQPLIQRAA